MHRDLLVANLSYVKLNTIMATVNNKLLPKEGETTSQPWQWPLDYKVSSI
jgi:dolichyl-phosphate-mannose--protein O-mannosyl transferase